MKRILVFSHALELGGAERALIGMLNGFDLTKYKVDLFLMRHAGELMTDIPEGINLLPENPKYASLAVPITQVVKKLQFGVAFGRILGKFSAKKRVQKLGLPSDNGVALDFSHKYTLKYMPKVSDTEYDLAISFLTPHYFVQDKGKAKKKIAWIHTDYSAVAVDKASESLMWGRYDHIISISEAVTAGFTKTFPQLADKIIQIENVTPISIIERNSKKSDFAIDMPDDGSIKILSVGRYCVAKNFDNVPDICKRLLDMGLNVKWYIIGFGGDEELIRSKIKEFGMEERVIMLGKKDNPYPYMAKCDLYAQPSRYEGKCVSVREAQILGKPVVITNYATSSSQLNDGFDGVIVPMDNESCAKGIAELLQDKERMKKLSENCLSSDYSGREEIEKIYKLIED